MELLEVIKIWVQFIPYIVYNNIAPFYQLVTLAQTCREFRKYFYNNFKAYSLLCQFYSKKIKISIFQKPINFYQNRYEKYLFHKIYAASKYKFNIKIHNNCTIT